MPVYSCSFHSHSFHNFINIKTSSQHQFIPLAQREIHYFVFVEDLWQNWLQRPRNLEIMELSIHFLYTLHPVQGRRRELKPISAFIKQEEGYSLGRSTICRRTTEKKKTTFLHKLNYLACLWTTESVCIFLFFIFFNGKMTLSNSKVLCHNSLMDLEPVQVVGVHSMAMNRIED